jgi:hypothetical protein
MEVKIMAPLKEEPNGWNAVIRMVLNLITFLIGKSAKLEINYLLFNAKKSNIAVYL